jgi:broad specificity phosphatase PhoE
MIFLLVITFVAGLITNRFQAGTSLEADSYKADASLSPQGEDYARKMTDRLLEHIEMEKKKLFEQGDLEGARRPLIVWTSTRRRTVETGQFLHQKGYKVRHRPQMSQLNPGVCEKMSERRLRQEYPDEIEKHEMDPYHHRYPRAEVCLWCLSALLFLAKHSQSYHDLAVRLEPIILELERERNDLLIIAHESVLRVLYGYLMACTSADIPYLSFPRNEIIEVSTYFLIPSFRSHAKANILGKIIPASYNNQAARIHIDDLPPEIIPGSPEDIKIPVPPSGIVSPMPALDIPRGATPQSGVRTPRDPEKILQHHVEDVV